MQPSLSPLRAPSHPTRSVTPIGKVLPEVAAYCDVPIEARAFSLHPDESSLIEQQKMSASRQAEFELGRLCTRAAMAKLGRLDFPILMGPSKAPVWPEDIVGSITHCPDYCAAAVARVQHISALGIDAQAWQNFPTDIAEEISTPWELERMEPTIDMRLKLGVLFSAKKSIFKALNPIVDRFFDFRSVVLTVDFGDRSFRIVSVDSPDLDRLKAFVVGQFSVARTVALTSALMLTSRK